MNSKMTPGYIAESVQLRERQAREYPVMFLFGESIRIASFMALVLVIADVLSPDVFAWSGGARLRFIAYFGVAMGAFNLAMTRWRRRSTTIE